MKTLACLLVLLALVLPTGAASIPGTIVAAKVTTGNDANTFSIGDSNEMAGTPKSVGTLTQRDAITTERRVVGMTCWVQDEGAEYQLIGGISNTNWVLRATATYNYTTNFYFTYLTNLFVDNSVSNYYMTNLVYNNNISNYFTTNVAYYSYTTNEFFTNIVNNDTYVSNFWYTNWEVFPTYVSNYFWTNYYTTITNIVTNITTINFSTNIYITNLLARYITNDYFYTTNIITKNAWITNLYSTNLYSTNIYVKNVYVTEFSGLTNRFDRAFVTNNIGYQTNLWAGPTNLVDVGQRRQRFVLAEAKDCSITNFSLSTDPDKAYSVVLQIRNVAGSNQKLYLDCPTTGTGDGARSYTLTNGTTTIVSIDFVPAEETNFVIRTLW